MSSSSYIVLQVHQLPADREELFVHHCFELGAQGVSEALEFQQNSADFEPVTMEKEFKELEVYFATSGQTTTLLEKLKSLFPELAMELREEKNRDWLEEWKKGFVPFPLVKDIWLVPSWCSVPEAAHHQIRIDPGMAFGTGTHETTQLAAGAIEALFHRSPKPQRVLDVGTGTGILALLAELLGAEAVVATEIDPEARRVARENCQINSSQQVQVVDEQIEGLPSLSFDLVVANIIDGVLLRLQKDLWRVLQPKGHLLITGILLEREKEFCHNFGLPEGRSWQGRLQKGEWVGYLL